MKKITLILAALVLPGCAGLDVTYDFRATYISEELIAKRQAEADRQRTAQRVEELPRAQLP